MRAIEALVGSPAIHRIGWALLHSLWQSTALALLLAVTLRRLRRASAEARYLAACVALLAMATLPAATSGVLSPDDGPADTVGSAAPAHRSGAIGGEADRPAATGPNSSPLSRLTTIGRPRALLTPMVAAWMVGVVALSLRLLGGWLLVRRLVHDRARPVAGPAIAALAGLSRAMRIRRRVRLRESPLAGVPMVIGAFRPVILLPAAAATGLTPGQLEALLAHELAHIRRHDYAVNLAQSLIEVLLFYHPAARWVSRVIRAEREHCCDDMAVRACGDRLAYVRALAAMEGLRGAPHLSLAATGGTLLGRVRRLLGLEVESMHRPPVAGLGVALLIGSWLLAGAAAQQVGGPAAHGPANPRSEGRPSPARDRRKGTVYVPVFRSVSFRRDVQFQLTELVIKEIERRTPCKVVGNVEEADTILEGTINFADRNLIVENPFNLPRQLTARVQASVHWIHNPPLEVEKSRAPRPVSETVNFAPELGETSMTAFYRANQNLATQIVDMMEVPWPSPDRPAPGALPRVPGGGAKPARGMAPVDDQEAERAFRVGDYYQRVGKLTSAEFYFGKIRRRWPRSAWAARAEGRLDVLAEMPR